MLVWHEDFLVQVLGQQMGGGGLLTGWKLELAAVLMEGANMSLRSLLSNGSELLTPALSRRACSLVLVEMPTCGILYGGRVTFLRLGH